MELADSGLLGNVVEVRLARNGFTGRSDWQAIDIYGGGQLLNWGPTSLTMRLTSAAVTTPTFMPKPAKPWQAATVKTISNW